MKRTRCRDEHAAHPHPNQAGLVVDLDTCVGCHACAVNCKEWNTGGHIAPLTDLSPYSKGQDGVWFNRTHSYEVEAPAGAANMTVHFPRSCLHCENAACVSTCQAGGRHFGDLGDPNSEVSTLVAQRDGYDLMAEMGYKPTNKYLPPRPRAPEASGSSADAGDHISNPLLRWADRFLSRKEI